MNQLIDKILTEWAYRVDDGMPNPANEVHMIHLEESLNELNLPKPVVKKVLEKVRTYVDNSMNRKLKRVGKPWGSKGDTTTDKSVSSTDTDTQTKELTPKEKRAEKYKKQIESPGSNTDTDVRINSEEVKAEIEQDAAEDEKLGKEMREMMGALDSLEGSMRDKALLLTALGQTYGRRDNAGFGKNNFGIVDRDQLNRNKDNLIEGYDEAKPEKVEKFVRSVRKNKVSEEFVNESFDTLPPALKTYLKGAGQGGSIVGDQHFLGYKTKDGGITSDRNDPNIQTDENGIPVAARGKLPSSHRAKLVWRIYLEQGGVCAYTGMPLDLESMDLEHVVGIQNTDQGDPKNHVHNREHERNHVLTSSRANQRKSDMNMKDFFKAEVDPLNDKTESDFKAMEAGIEKVGTMQPRTEQTALRMMDEVTFRTKDGKIITQSDYLAMSEDERPKLKTTDLGTPKVVDANLGPNVTKDSLQAEFDFEEKEFAETRNTLKEQLPEEDKKKADGIQTKIGKRTINAMGLPGGLQHESGRRSIDISGSDNFYKGYCIAMATAPPEERQKYKEAWQDCRKHANSRDEKGRLLNGKTYGKNQKTAFTKCIRDKGLIQEEVLNDPRYAKVWRYKNEKGEVV